MPASKIKQSLAALLNLTGWFEYQSRQKIEGNALILMYHRVLPDPVQSPVPVPAGMYVTPDSLRVQLTYLKSKYDVVSLQDLVQHLQSGVDVSRCCAITFDDGWLDNYLYAYPLCCELNLPITIFLTTGFIGTAKWFWPEEVAWCISHASKKGKTSLLPAGLLDILNTTGTERGSVAEKIDSIVESVKRLNPMRRAELIEGCTEYREAVCKGKSERLLLNWDEVREMKESGLVSFGSHTISHVLLDQLHRQELQHQLTVSREQLEMETGDHVELLAYPNGNFSQEVIEMLPNCGYKAAVTTQRGFVNNTTHPFELPRIAIHDDVSHTLNLFRWRLFVR